MFHSKLGLLLGKIIWVILDHRVIKYNPGHLVVKTITEWSTLDHRVIKGYFLVTEWSENTGYLNHRVIEHNPSHRVVKHDHRVVMS